jgi:hypothetical protein
MLARCDYVIRGWSVGAAGLYWLNLVRSLKCTLLIIKDLMEHTHVLEYCHY